MPPHVLTANISKETPPRMHLQSTTHQTASSSLALEGFCTALQFPSSTTQLCYHARSQEKQRGLCTAARVTHILALGLSASRQGSLGTRMGRRAGILHSTTLLSVCPDLTAAAAEPTVDTEIREVGFSLYFLITESWTVLNPFLTWDLFIGHLII